MRLRPLLTLLGFLLLTPGPLAGQFTVKGGLNLVDLFGDGVESSDSRARLAAGGGFDLLSLGPFVVSPEVYYAQKGAGEMETGVQQGRPADVSLEYVEIPLLLKLELPLGGSRFFPYVAGGPVFGWQLDCDVRATEGGVEDNCDDILGGSEQLEETLRSYEQGLTFGAGFAFDVLRGFGGLTVDARYSVGLTRLSESDDGPDIQNRAFALLLGYRLGR